MKAGIAKINITPPVGTDLTGYISRPGSATKVHDELNATALVLDDGDKRICILTLDLLGPDLTQDKALRESISKATEINQENILMASSHTHAGPALGTLRQCGEADETYVRWLWSQAVAVTKEACQKLVDARLSFARGESELAWNRREAAIKASAEKNGTSGVVPTDPEISALLVEMDGEKPVLLFNYACHGVVMDADNVEISADWIGAARDMLLASGRIGTAMFLQGCGGNINPRWRGTFEEVKRAGESVAGPIISALQNAEPVDNPKIKVAWRNVDAPYLPLPAEEELEQEISYRRSEIQTTQAEGGSIVVVKAHTAMLDWAQDALKMLNEGGGPASVTIPLQAISIGNIVFTSLPGEAFCEYGLAFRKMTKSHVMPVAYANGNIGYIPTAEAYQEGGYEIDSAIRYYGVKMIGPETEGIILDAMKEMLAEVG